MASTLVHDNDSRVVVRKPQGFQLLLLILLSLPLADVVADAWVQSTRLPPSRLRKLCLADKENTDHPDDNFHTLPRLYVPHARLSDGMKVVLAPDQAHYVTKVMRIGKKKSRNSVRVFDGKNGEWLAQIHVDEDETSQNKKRRRDDVTITAQCTRQLRPQVNNNNTTNPLSEPWLFFAPLKKQRVKLMLEKCTELGVGRFVPLVTERTDPSSIRDFTRNMDDKLAAQTIEASEQSERLTVPPLSKTCLSNGMKDPWDLSTLLNEWSTRDTFRNRHLLICRERTADCSVPVLKLLESLACCDETVAGVALVIGPEGGWSPAEEALCDHYTKASNNIHCVSLGSLVLRAETAAITAVSACMLCQELFDNDDKVTNKS